MKLMFCHSLLDSSRYFSFLASPHLQRQHFFDLVKQGKLPPTGIRLTNPVHDVLSDLASAGSRLFLSLRSYCGGSSDLRVEGSNPGCIKKVKLRLSIEIAGLRVMFWV